MRKEGLEPPYPFGYQILSLARLPVPPLSRASQPNRWKAPGPRPQAQGPRNQGWSRNQALCLDQPCGLGPEAFAIRGFTAARAAGTFVMMSSSTGPRDDARELMARRAGTR